MQQRRSIITTGPIILPVIQLQLAALHRSVIACPITFLLPRAQTMMAAPNRCIGGFFNRGTKRAGIYISKRDSEEGETGADY